MGFDKFFKKYHSHNEGDREHAADKFGLTPDEDSNNNLETMDGRVGTDGSTLTSGYHEKPLDTTPSEN